LFDKTNKLCVITIGTQAYNLLLIRTMIAYVVYGKMCV